MAPPRAAGPRRSQLPNEHIYTLGERGRKTGVTLRDTGVRDEHGMEPMESIFSSPSKSTDGDAHDASEEEGDEGEGADEEDDDDDDGGGEADMDLTTVAGPDPAALLNGQSTAARLAMRQQARSPATARSLFGSPAVRGGPNNKGAAAGGDPKPKNGALRQNQLLRPPPSPDAAAAQPSSPVKPVKRRLDFGKPVSASTQRKPVLLPAAARRMQEEEEDDDEESILHGNQDGGADDSMQMIAEPNEFADDESEEPEEPAAAEEEEEEEPVAAKKRGRPAAKKSTAKESAPKEAVGKAANGAKRGRPGRISGGSDAQPSAPDEADEEQSSAKRQRVEAKPRGRPKGRPAASKQEEQPEEAAEESQASKGAKRATKKKSAEEAVAAAAAGKKKDGRGRKSSGVGAAMAAAAAVPRGPPLPKSRGLVIRRRENDEDGTMKRTRSGRTSYQPLAFWRNEHAEFETSEVADATWRGGHKGADRRIVLPAMREIYRVEEEDLPPLGGTGRGGGGGGGSSSQRRRKNKASAKRRGDDDDDDDDNGAEGPERQAWEHDPGRVEGQVAVWRPEHELEPPGPDDDVEQAETEIALSALAIQTQDVRDGSFRFAKTLSLPFFGTGIVDLAPGAEKRPKNSRKMHMAFFVHYGHVAVTVNETEFRIAKGGMWSVPRGNYYSIVNDTDRPARIFFSQGCEMLTVLETEED